MLRGQNYVSITLTWDSKVTLTNENENGKYDAGATLTRQALANYDLYLVPAGPTARSAVAAPV